MTTDRNRADDGNDLPTGGNPPDTPREPDRPRRRRRWPWIVGFVMLCMIIGLVVMALILPTVVSSDRGTSYLLSMVNQQLRGTVKVQDVDLSWRRASRIQGVTLLDPQDRQVLTADRVVVQTALWNIVRSPLSFGQVDLEKPAVVVYLQEDQPPSLVQAVEPREPSKEEPKVEEEAGPPPKPKGQLVIHGGSVRIVKPDGQELGVSSLNGQVMLDTLNNIQGQLAAQIQQGGQIQAAANIKNLAANDKIDINQATGQFNVQTKEDVAIAPLMSFLDQPAVHGLANLDVQGQMDRGAIAADLKTQVRQFYTPTTQKGEQQAQPQPIDLALVGQVRRSADEKINGTMDLSGGAGTANAQFAYAPTTQPASEAAGAPAAQPSPTGENLVAMLLTGKPVDLPNVQAAVKANLDLQALTAAAPELLRIQEGVEITRGQLQVSDLQVRTQPALSAVGAVRLADLAATRNGQPIDVQPVALDVNAHVVPNQGLQVERGELQSSFAQASVAGNPESLKGQFDADLARLDQQLRQLVDLGDLQLAGRLDGRFTATRENENEIKVASSIRAADVRYVSGDTQLNVQQATLNPNASLLLQGQNLQRVVLHDVDADIDQRIRMTAGGWYDFAGKSWKTDVTLQEAQLPYLVAKGRELGIQALEQYAEHSGSISDLRLTASWDPQAEAITANGQGTFAGLGVDGKTVAENVAMRWEDAQYSTKTRQASLASATVKADDFANLAAENFQYEPGEVLKVNGRVRAGADVARTLSAVYTLTGKPAPALAGQLELAGDMRTEGNVVSLAGEATVNDFAVGQGEQAFRQQQVQLAYDTRVDNANETIDLRQVKLTSAPLTASLVGTVQEFRSRQMLDIQGDYQANWDQVMPILHEVVPATAESVDLRGTSASRFTVAGPAWQENVQPPYRNVTAEGFDVGWQSGQVYGLQLGKGVLSPRLRNGVLELPRTSIPASGGAVNLGGTVDMTQPTPLLRIPGQLQVLQDVDLSSEIGKQLLSYVNPLFSHVAAMEGKVSMVIQDIDLPMGEEIKRTGSGRGQLNMENVRVEPGGTFGTLIRIAGTAGPAQGGQQGRQGAFGALGGLGQAVRPGQQAPAGRDQPMGAVDIRIGNPTFVISNGRINYDNFVLTLANGAELVFSGWVGFDDTVQMFVGMPVTAGLLESAGVKGPVAQYASVLEGARIDVPLTGSRTNPQLDFSKIDVKPLVDRAIRNLATKGVEQGIRTAIPGGQVLPELLPGQQQQGQPGERRDLLPGVPAPRLPGLDGRQQQPPSPPPGAAEQAPPPPPPPASPGQQIESGLRGIFGGEKKDQEQR